MATLKYNQIHHAPGYNDTFTNEVGKTTTGAGYHSDEGHFTLTSKGTVSVRSAAEHNLEGPYLYIGTGSSAIENSAAIFTFDQPVQSIAYNMWGLETVETIPGNYSKLEVYDTNGVLIYTVFCTPAGEHSVESYVGDAPLYTGKRNPQSYARLEGGQTYVLEAPLESSTPIVHTGRDAEQSLQGKRRQIHVLSRATSVVPCQGETKLTLRSDVLFAFGKSGYKDLTPEGRAMLDQAVRDIQQKGAGVSSIEVIGHADPIGNAQANQSLSLRRAETVRKVLLEEGIQSQLVHASGRGSSEPVVQCDNSARKSRVACNAPNRRVELVIQNKGE
ncbi:OmpA family protein [Pseudomonas sp. Pseusp97]|uniref:OmpA family protein n=1 Tax=Pseudomonas sp. Pseusp97 TaxID=3243065 RepID=UPI0039A6C630